LIFFVGLFFYSLLFPVDCKENSSCFNQKSADCQRSKFTLYNEDNKFQYSIVGNDKENCVIDIKLEKTSLSSSQEIKDNFEGKSMRCSIPTAQLKISSIQETSNILSYCTGPLKEATLELMIKKLYGVIAQNLGSIISQAGNSTK
jgi:hypothetical protein